MDDKWLEQIEQERKRADRLISLVVFVIIGGALTVVAGLLFSIGWLALVGALIMLVTAILLVIG